jgi:endonuclease YncB( thermonuclease family)
MTPKQRSLVASDTRIASSRYKKLVSDISFIYEGTKKTVAKAYWDIGKQLVEVEQEGAVRAAYGAGLIAKLSEELTQKLGSGLSAQNLRRMRNFYLAVPDLDLSNGLTWSQYVAVLPLESRAAQKRILRQAQREHLGIRMIRKLVRSECGRCRRSQNGVPPELLTPVRGKTGTYSIALKAGELCLDLGFRNYRGLTPAEASRFKEGAIVEFAEDGELKELPADAVRDLHTYEAKPDRVCDGDTQWYFIFLNRGERRIIKHDKLRLRGIDCPELGTPEGKTAKAFTEKLFSRAVKVTVTTTKPDKYDRYLSDVFLGMADGSELFLNNELLAAGHADLYAVSGPVDWGE